MLERVIGFYPGKNRRAIEFAGEVEKFFISVGVRFSAYDIWSDISDVPIEEADLLICIGGDGTVLRAAQISIPHGVPILGVNMGRLGFLTDLNSDQFWVLKNRILEADWKLEERVMVQGEVLDGSSAGKIVHGLNDIIVSRITPGRPVYVELHIDGGRVARYRCDGMIIATPTGSTGYSLSAGGPIIAPTEKHLVVTPVSAHLAIGQSLVLEASSNALITVGSDEGAILSVDGQNEINLSGGDRVATRISDHITRFVRFSDATSFYVDLAARLEVQFSSAMNEGN